MAIISQIKSIGGGVSNGCRWGALGGLKQTFKHK